MNLHAVNEPLAHANTPIDIRPEPKQSKTEFPTMLSRLYSPEALLSHQVSVMFVFRLDWMFGSATVTTRAYKREASVAFPLGVVRAILKLREKASQIDTFRASPLPLWIEQFRFPSPLFPIISRSKTLRTVLTRCTASSDVIPWPFPLFPLCS